MSNELTAQDLKHKGELFRSNSQCNTRLYTVELLKDWTLVGFQRDAPPHPTGADVSNKFRKGETVVVKLYVDGPEEERRADAKRRRDNEYKRLRKLNKKLRVLRAEDNWYVMALGTGENLQSTLPGPFLILEQGECSLGHLLHRRKNECPTQTEEPSRFSVEGNAFYTKDHCFSFIIQLHNALDYLHKCDMVHRDLKSYNVLLFNNKTLCKLCDFEDCRDVSPKMTAKMGTTWWRAPETYLEIDSDGNTEYGIAADWFSFGLLMCELLFREEPFMCYYTGCMADRPLDPSKVFCDKFLSTVPKFTEVDQRAMCIDHTTNPGSPKVLINTKQCQFPEFRQRSDAPKLWKLIDRLLLWDPSKRLAGEDLVSLFETDIRPYATESPQPIYLQESLELTDTGANSNTTAMSWRSAESVFKVYLLATRCDLDNDDVVNHVKARLQERTVDIPGMIPADSDVEKLCFEFYYKRSLNRFVLLIKGESVCADRTAHFCKTDKQFVNYMTRQFQFHPKLLVRGLKLEVKPKDIQA